jgi:glycine cleavage system H protein
MAKVPAELRYTKDHEWAEKHGQTVRIGITDYAQEHLGDVVMVELPKVGQVVATGKAFGTVESPKSVSDIFAPIGGKVTAVNSALDGNPERVNADCYGEGWIVELEPANPAELDGLLDAAAYTAHLAELDAH